MRLSRRKRLVDRAADLGLKLKPVCVSEHFPRPEDPLVESSYLGAAVDQSVKGTARPPRTTVRITWSKPL
jgi:hypothetical protein